MRGTRWMNAGLCAGLLLSGGVVRAEQSPSKATAKSYQNGDQEFLEQALGVNQLELQLGRLAAERASTPEVKAMGQKMVQKHTELGQQLSGVAQQSGGSGSPELSPDQRAIYDRVASQSGTAFDAIFKQTVDAGHVKELAMYRDEVSRAANPQLRVLAEGRVAKLQETVAQAEAPKKQHKHDW
ncbi:MAG: outer membrane protein [bacterium]|jgi:putative membrane protein|nr:outer membrane protein [bacterium]